MITFPTRNLILEGPDLAGKGTLYRKIHKASDFKWNIRDRSWLSQLVYAKQYGRDTGLRAQGLWEELCCLNNRMVLMLPNLASVIERYEVRGDDIQDAESLERVVDLFHDHDWLAGFPNVQMLDNSNSGLSALEDDVDTVVGWLKTKEEYDLSDIASEVLRFVSVMPGGSPDNMRGYEASLNFTFYDDGCFEEALSWEELSTDPDEGAYYKSIRDALLTKIDNEIKGNNEYNKPQTQASRRFVYAGDSCISLIHVMFRGGIMDFHAVCRSTNVAQTLSKDLNFLYFMASDILQEFPQFMENLRSVRFRIHLNSAHLVP